MCSKFNFNAKWLLVQLSWTWITLKTQESTYIFYNSNLFSAINKTLSSSPDLGARNNFGKFQKFFEKKFFFCCFIFLNNILYGTTDGLIENRRVLWGSTLPQFPISNSLFVYFEHLSRLAGNGFNLVTCKPFSDVHTHNYATDLKIFQY